MEKIMSMMSADKRIGERWMRAAVLLCAVTMPVGAQEALWLTTSGKECPLMRKEFALPAAPVKGVVRIVGLGHFQLFVNGRMAGDAAIHQAWSQYDKTIYVEEIDVTGQLREGANALGVMLGNSFWYSPAAPKGRYQKGGVETDFGTPFLLWTETEIETKDGGHTRVVSDASWKTAASPVTFSHVYAGEDYDARLEQPGWDQAGFGDAKWTAAVVTKAPPGRLVKQDWPTIREKEVFPMREAVAGEPGVFHVFFGQNASGVLRFTVQGKAGQSFTVQPSEYRTDDGQFMKPRWGDPVLCRYTLKGGEPETHQWLFHYNGFQVVELVGAVPNSPGLLTPRRFKSVGVHPAEPKAAVPAAQPNQGVPAAEWKGAAPGDLANSDGLPVVSRMELVHTRTDLPVVGTFTSSSKLYNDIQTLIDWAVRSNMSYVMTDCPHREKLGWLECAHLLAPTFCYRYDGREWFAKIARDIRDAQEPSGRILTVAPSYPGTRFPGAFHWTVEWGAAGVLVPWHHYVWYGDPRILRDNYDCMRRFVDYVASTSKDGIAPAGLGDWYDYGHGQPPGESRFTPTDLTATAVQVMCIDAVIRSAQVLDRKEDVTRYRDLRAKTAASFLRKFYDPDRKMFANKGSCQCANTIALAAGLVPDEDRKAVVDAVVADLEKRGWQQTPGDVGHVYFIRALAEAGRSDVLHKVYSRDGLGSYGGILKKGLTALPETWDAMNDGGASLNHCMLGHVIEWFYGYVGGIRQQPVCVGWKRILIAPIPGNLEHAECTFDSPAGRIVSRWRVADGKFTLDAEVPVGVTARLVTPDGVAKEVGGGTHRVECGYARAGR